MKKKNRIEENFLGVRAKIVILFGNIAAKWEKL